MGFPEGSRAKCTNSFSVKAPIGALLVEGVGLIFKDVAVCPGSLLRHNPYTNQILLYLSNKMYYYI
jgi:hypothetical protein